ncbi:hypothetical protein FRC12_000074 [Ceratobasidium sp. 428]|nr:hypothetical protein FRC12_000074 [Ceratobasidium sp. 428]
MSFGGSLVTSGNKLSGSSSNDHIQGPHMLNFSEVKGFYRRGNSWEWQIPRWGSPGRLTAEWYRSQPTRRFTSIEHRKERAGPFFHEFIVIHFDNDTVCRFDRRGDPTTRANAFTTEGVTAEDTAHVIQKHESHYDKIYSTSDLLLQINFPRSMNLLMILYACYRIKRCETTRSYSLFEHNCYFFSWTILAAVLNLNHSWLYLDNLRRKLAYQKSSLVSLTEKLLDIWI